MKKLLLGLLFLFSLQSFAKSVDYTCAVRYYQLNITIDEESTSMFVIDRMSHETLYVGYVAHIETQGNFKKYYFYPSNGKESVLTFNTQDIEDQVDRTSGWIDGQFNGWPIYDSFICLKNTNH